MIFKQSTSYRLVQIAITRKGVINIRLRAVSYSIILMASLAFFFLKHALGYNVYPAPPFSDCDHLFWMTILQFSIAGFYPPVGDNLRNGLIHLYVRCIYCTTSN